MERTQGPKDLVFNFLGYLPHLVFPDQAFCVKLLQRVLQFSLFSFPCTFSAEVPQTVDIITESGFAFISHKMEILVTV